MNSVYFLDLFLFVFVLHYVFYFDGGMMSILIFKFKGLISKVFGYDFSLPMSFLVSFFVFNFLLVCCFGGYFVYSFCPCGMIEFTMFFSLVAWLSTMLSFVSSEKFSVYMSKGGDVFLKSFSMLLVEIVSEFSRPVALTVRLTVNVMVGHLISYSIYVFLSSCVGLFLVWFSVFAIMMECFVFFIQSYIFSRLIYLYLSE